nr:hypothetical protein [uncultured Carboxylicivirga sp.]
MEDKIFSVISKIYYFVTALIKIVLKSNFRLKSQLRKIVHENNYERKTIRILGNGKSLNDENFELFITGVDYLVLNRHVLSPSYEHLKPSYYVLADPHFFEHKDGVKIVDEIMIKTDWSLILFIPFSGKNKKLLKNKLENNQFVKPVYFNQTSMESFETINKVFYKLNLAMPRVQNVLVASIFLSIYLKYKTIELYGVEHSWTKYLFVNNENEVYLDNTHFFDTKKSAPKSWKEIQGKSAKLHEVLRMYAKMFESYHSLQTLAECNKTKIVNMTKGSFIDAFVKK